MKHSKVNSYHPIFLSPTPPGKDLTYFGSAKRETGFIAPVEKYAPTGPVITYRRALLADAIPSEG